MSLFRRLKKRIAEYRLGDILLFLFFFVLSGVFWLMQNLKDEYDLRVAAPLLLEEVPDDVIITSALPHYISATIHGQGTALIRHYSGRLTPVTIDFSRYDRGQEVGIVRVPAGDVRAALDRKLADGVRIVTLDCDSLEFSFSRGVSRRLPVKVTGEITTAAHCYLRSLSVEPDSVEVYAPRAVLDTMRVAYTQPQNHQKLDRSRTYIASFVEQAGVSYSPTNVRVQANVDYYTEKSLEVPILGEGFPEGATLCAFPAKATLSFRVGASQFDRVTPSSFRLVLSYDELMQNQQKTISLHLDSLPEAVTDVVIQPSEVEYLIKWEQAEEGGQE